MRRALVVLALLLSPALAGAQTLTTRDIVDLSKAGLGDEALLALIEVHRPIFPVDVVTLKALKDAGVSPAVIIAMIKSGRTAPPPPLPLPQPLELPVPPEPAAPQIIVLESHHHDEPPSVREVAVPVPVYIPVRTRLRADRAADRLDDRHDSPSRPSTRPHKAAEPVYWGWGGKLRPDAWKPTAADVQKDAKIPREPQRR